MRNGSASVHAAVCLSRAAHRIESRGSNGDLVLASTLRFLAGTELIRESVRLGSADSTRRGAVQVKMCANLSEYEYNMSQEDDVRSKLRAPPLSRSETAAKARALVLLAKEMDVEAETNPILSGISTMLRGRAADVLAQVRIPDPNNPNRTVPDPKFSALARKVDARPKVREVLEDIRTELHDAVRMDAQDHDVPAYAGVG